MGSGEDSREGTFHSALLVRSPVPLPHHKLSDRKIKGKKKENRKVNQSTEVGGGVTGGAG